MIIGLNRVKSASWSYNYSENKLCIQIDINYVEAVFLTFDFFQFLLKYHDSGFDCDLKLSQFLYLSDELVQFKCTSLLLSFQVEL